MISTALAAGLFLTVVGLAASGSASKTCCAAAGARAAASAPSPNGASTLSPASGCRFVLTKTLAPAQGTPTQA